MQTITHIGCHTHQYGNTSYPICFTGDGFPDVHAFVKEHNIDVEPDKNETFEFIDIDNDFVVFDKGCENMTAIFPGDDLDDVED